ATHYPLAISTLARSSGEKQFRYRGSWCSLSAANANRNGKGRQAMKYRTQLTLAAGAGIGLLGATLAPAQDSFPLAAPAGVDSKARALAPPGAVNQGQFDAGTWKYG